MNTWKIALPMYAISPRLRAANQQLLEQLIDALAALGWRDPLRIVEPDFSHIDQHWLDPQLLLSQTCGYPLMTRLQGKVRVLGVPRYRAEGIEGGRYRSRLIVAAQRHYQHLSDLRGAVAVINNEDSHSGMNALRHSLAALAPDGGFLRRVWVSGSHAASVDAVRTGQADIAAIDPLTWAHLHDEAPERLAGLRTLGWSAPAPTLPWIGALALHDEQVAQLQTALATTLANAPPLAHTLRIEGFASTTWPDYQRILDMAAATPDALGVIGARHD